MSAEVISLDMLDADVGPGVEAGPGVGVSGGAGVSAGADVAVGEGTSVLVGSETFLTAGADMVGLLSPPQAITAATRTRPADSTSEWKRTVISSV